MPRSDRADGSIGWRRGVAAVVLAEGALLVLVGGYLGVESVVGTATQPAAALTLAVITLAVGVALLVAGRGVADGRRWSRSPILVWQLLQAAGASSSVLPGGWYVRGPLLTASIVAVVGLLRAGVIDVDDS